MENEIKQENLNKFYSYLNERQGILLKSYNRLNPRKMSKKRFLLVAREIARINKKFKELFPNVKETEYF